MHPVCPDCKEPLVARLSDRRFMEDDFYAECPNGHLWDLMAEQLLRELWADESVRAAVGDGHPLHEQITKRLQ